MIGSTMFSGVVVLWMWGSSHGFISLLIFGMLYGLFSGGYNVVPVKVSTGLVSHMPGPTHTRI